MDLLGVGSSIFLWYSYSITGGVIQLHFFFQNKHLRILFVCLYNKSTVYYVHKYSKSILKKIKKKNNNKGVPSKVFSLLPPALITERLNRLFQHHKNLWLSLVLEIGSQ
jgi:hypothetical protein